MKNWYGSGFIENDVAIIWPTKTKWAVAYVACVDGGHIRYVLYYTKETNARKHALAFYLKGTQFDWG